MPGTSAAEALSPTKECVESVGGDVRDDFFGWFVTEVGAGFIVMGFLRRSGNSASAQPALTVLQATTGAGNLG